MSNKPNEQLTTIMSTIFTRIHHDLLNKIWGIQASLDLQEYELALTATKQLLQTLTSFNLEHQLSLNSQQIQSNIHTPHISISYLLLWLAQKQYQSLIITQEQNQFIIHIHNIVLNDQEKQLFSKQSYSSSIYTIYLELLLMYAHFYIYNSDNSLDVHIKYN